MSSDRSNFILATLFFASAAVAFATPVNATFTEADTVIGINAKAQSKRVAYDKFVSRQASDAASTGLSGDAVLAVFAALQKTCSGSCVMAR
ncbi:MAG: hypothetical protein ACFBZ9_11590 [Sphingomonadales bacterium]